VHGNDRAENLLVTAKGWYVMDLDDLRLGDPAVDFATLFWSLDEGGLGRGTEGLLEVFNGQPDLQARLPLYFRVLLLQEAAGSLVEYVRVEAYPDQAPAVRESKVKRHQEALARYRELYG
jgi:aminoglycoside phosphotransferase (APT) family kinase protein